MSGQRGMRRERERERAESFLLDTDSPPTSRYQGGEDTKISNMTLCLILCIHINCCYGFTLYINAWKTLAWLAPIDGLRDGRSEITPSR